MIGKYKARDWIILLRSQSNIILAAPCEKRGRMLHIGQLSEIDDPGKIRCNTCWIVLHSPRIFILKDQFPVARTDVFTMMVDERIRQEGYFGTDATFAHAFKKLSVSGKQQQVVVISQPAELLERAADIAEQTGAGRVASIVSAPAAVAALMDRLVGGPVIAVLIRDNSCEYIVCQDGYPEFIQASPLEISGEQTPAMLVQGLNAVASRAADAIGRPVKDVIFMGQGVDYSEVVNQGFRVIKPDLGQYVQVENPQDLRAHPELAGVHYADPDLDFLPRAWRAAYKFQKLACVTAISAAVAAVLLMFGAYNLNDAVQGLKTRYQREYQSLSGMIERLEPRLPGMKETETLQTLARLREQSLVEPRIDEVLLNMAGALPDTVRIGKFKAEREVAGPAVARGNRHYPEPPKVPPAGGEGRIAGASALSEVEKALSGSMVFHVTLVTEGDFIRVRTRFEDALRNMTSNFDVKDVYWSYDETLLRGQMRCDIRVRSGREL